MLSNDPSRTISPTLLKLTSVMKMEALIKGYLFYELAVIVLVGWYCLTVCLCKPASGAARRLFSILSQKPAAPHCSPDPRDVSPAQDRNNNTLGPNNETCFTISYGQGEWNLILSNTWSWTKDTVHDAMACSRFMSIGFSELVVTAS